MKTILEIEGVYQVFRDGFWMKKIEVLHGVSFKVEEGTIFGFVGANGAGKTTLIQLIVGLRKPTKGTVRVLGHNASSREGKLDLGYLPERPYFYDHLTAEQLLNYFGVLSGMGGALIRKRIPEVLSQVSLSDFKKLELKKFSKGMLQRIGIAQSLLHDPKVLVFDEPMSGLDPIGRKEIRQLMQSLKAAGKTVFFSTHIIPDVEEICDQVAVIQKGVLKVSGPTHQFKTASEIESFFYEPVAKTSEEKNTHEK